LRPSLGKYATTKLTQEKTMPQSLSQCWMHIIFSTKNRTPFPTNPDIKIKLYDYIKAVCFNHHCPVISIGGIEDHIHILLSLNKNISLSLLIEKLKKTSSKWVKTVNDSTNEIKKFYWQSGYAAFSVSQSSLETIKSYINNQEAHHRKYSYQDELRKILNKYQIKYDEKYVWD
jgi:REP element-mobilizing transposase RayT